MYLYKDKKKVSQLWTIKKIKMFPIICGSQAYHKAIFPQITTWSYPYTNQRIRISFKNAQTPWKSDQIWLKLIIINVLDEMLLNY